MVIWKTVVEKTVELPKLFCILEYQKNLFSGTKSSLISTVWIAQLVERRVSAIATPGLMPRFGMWHGYGRQVWLGGFSQVSGTCLGFLHQYRPLVSTKDRACRQCSAASIVGALWVIMPVRCVCTHCRIHSGKQIKRASLWGTIDLSRESYTFQICCLWNRHCQGLKPGCIGERLVC